MKKISTTAAQKMEKVESQRLTVGLDLGDRSSWYCVLNEAGEVLLEQKVATTAKAMKAVFGGMPATEKLVLRIRVCPFRHTASGRKWFRLQPLLAAERLRLAQVLGRAQRLATND